MVNVKHPGPSVGGNTETHPHLVDMVTGALAPVGARAGRGRRGRQRLQLPVRRRPPEDGDYYTNYHIEGSGWGGTDDHDGNDCSIVDNGNCRNTPVEIFETKYPFGPSSTR